MRHNIPVLMLSSTFVYYIADCCELSKYLIAVTRSNEPSFLYNVMYDIVHYRNFKEGGVGRNNGLKLNSIFLLIRGSPGYPC